MKQIILVFPDYMSSGLWNYDDGVNMCPTELGINEYDQMVIRNWHYIWEYLIAVSDPDEVCKMSASFVKQWERDGKLIVRMLNAHYPQYKFKLKL